MKGTTNATQQTLFGEILNLRLITNLSSHEDLIGANIIIDYGIVKTYTWEGNEITIEIPPTVEYTVTVSEVEGYRIPPSLSFTAQIDNVNNLTLSYDCELVTINVNEDVSQDYLITISEKKSVDLGSTGEEAYEVIATQTTSTASHKIPFDIEYVITASNISGYIAPANQSFVALQPTRNVDMVYEEEKFGVLIYDIDGKLTNPDDWNTANNSKAVGVAILTDNCRFVVAKEDISTDAIRWGGYNTDISTLTNYTDAANAATDFDGVNNTAKIIAAIGNSNDGYRDGTAAGDCAAYTFPNGKTGYLGAAGEWQVARQNKDALNSALTLIGGTTMTEGGYWTSTEHSKYNAWDQWFASGSSLYDGIKYYDGYVRAFLSC